MSRILMPVCMALVFAGPADTAAQDLLVPSSDNDRVLRYDGETGAFIDVFASGGGLDLPLGTVCHTDGNLYVAGYNDDKVTRYDGDTGQLIGTFASGGGLDQAVDLAFGTDGHLYVSSFATDQVLRYDGTTGNFMDAFASGGPLDGPAGMAFGPDGHLYVGGFNSDAVIRYDGTTGALIGVFASGGGLDGVEGVAFGPDGHLYVSSFRTDQVMRYNGETGNFMGVFASGGGLDGPVGLIFGPDGHLYVASWNTDEVLRYDGKTGAFIATFVSAGSGGLDVPSYPSFCPPVVINAGVNDAWVSSEAPFQGFFFTAFPEHGLLFVSQFTFDSVLPAPPDSATFGAWDHRWVTGLGTIIGDRATVKVELTSGGIFNDSVPLAGQQQGYGTFIITFINCKSAILVYDFPGLGLSGRLVLTRVLEENVPLCRLLRAG